MIDSASNLLSRYSTTGTGSGASGKSVIVAMTAVSFGAYATKGAEGSYSSSSESSSTGIFIGDIGSSSVLEFAFSLVGLGLDLYFALYLLGVSNVGKGFSFGYCLGAGDLGAFGIGDEARFSVTFSYSYSIIYCWFLS